MKPIYKREDRMRHYEDRYRAVLPPKSYVILRVDGRAFHTLTRNMGRPFDKCFMQAMDKAAKALCEEVQGTAFAYVQSDEISLLMTDFGPQQEQWFGGVIQKMCSIAACVASNAFNTRIPALVGGLAQFDARVFTLPNRQEAINYFMWRQADCHRNAVSMAAEAFFSSEQLLGAKVAERMDMLMAAGVDFASYPPGARLGRVVTRHELTKEAIYQHKDTGESHTGTAVRILWKAEPADWFDWDEKGFLETAVPHAPS